MAARIITGGVKGTSHNLLYTETGLETLEKRRENTQTLMIHKMLKNESPQYLRNLIPPPRNNLHETR